MSIQMLKSIIISTHSLSSLALNFDDYLDGWSKVGMSLPSEMKDARIYSIAAEQSKLEKNRLYSKK